MPANSDKSQHPQWWLLESRDEEAGAAFERESLRRILAICLCIEYGVYRKSPYKLCKDGWLHYTNLSKISFEVFRSHHPIDHSPIMHWSDECCHHPLVDRYLKRPAVELGIPTRIVVGMLFRFCWHHSRIPGPILITNASCDFMLGWDTQAFGEKLLLDQQQLLDLLIPRSAIKLRNDILSWNSFNRRLWFRELNSPTDFRLHDKDKGTLFDDHAGSRKSREYTNSNMEETYAFLSYLGRAIQGFPGEEGPAWWKRGPFMLWARSCELQLFGIGN